MKLYFFPMLFTFLFQSVCNGQNYKIGVPFITNFTEKDFSVSNENWDIVQDNRGVIYLANDYGVLEFDGSHWNIIQAPPNHSIVRSLAFGPDNKLYVGAQDFFGYIEADSTGTLNLIPLTGLLPAVHKNIGNVWRIYRSGQKMVFFTWNEIFIYQSGKITIVKKKNPLKMLYKVGERLLVSDEHGLMELQKNTLVDLPNTVSLGNREIAFIAPYPENKLLIGCQDGEFFIYNGRQLSPFQLSDKNIFTNNKLQCGVLLRNDLYLAGTVESGLILFDKTGQVLRHITKTNGLGHNHIKQIFEDKDGNWWIINEMGLDIAEASAPIYKIVIDPENPFSVYTSFIFNRQLYVGSHAGLFTTDWSSFFNYQSHPVQFRKIPHIGDICWKLDTLAGNLYLFNGNGFYRIENDMATSLYHETGTWTFLRPKKDPHVLIVGTYNGLALFDMEHNIPVFRKNLAGFSETSRVMEEDADGNIWVAHGYKGVYKIMLNSSYDSILSVEFYNSRKGFPTDLFINVFDIKGRLVFGTQQGVYKYDESRDSMVVDPYFAKILGTTSHIRYLHEDRSGRIWYIKDQLTGVINLHPDGTWTIQNAPFQKLTGDYIPGFENFFFAENGDALIGTKNGLVFYNRQIPFQPKTSYSVLITSVTSPRNARVFYDERLRFFGDTAQLRHTEIPFKQNSLRFSYSACFYENIDQTRYSCYLEGNDDAWSDWSAEGFKDYTNLKEGKYAFHVKAKNVYEEESPETVYRFTILPPWYRTTYAYIAYFIVISFLIWLLMRIKTWRFEHEKRRIIEEQENKRKLQEIQYHEEKLMADLEGKNKELAATAMKILYKNEKILEIKKLIETLDPEAREGLPKKIESIRHFLEKELKDDQWDDFELRFDQANNNFIKRLKETYPDLSTWDLKICAYLRVNLSTKEIAQILNMTVRGVETARFRIRKRIGMDSADNLNDFILGF